jgi:hypothetical protein
MKMSFSRKKDLVTQELENELLIYDLQNNKAFCLNETSAFVWQECDGKKTVKEISDSLGKKMNQPANEDLVWFALTQLKKEKLVLGDLTSENHFAGLSRREIIKKVGLSTLIALPVIVSLIAPKAVNAQSVCNTTTIMFCNCPGIGLPGMSCGQDSCAAGCLCVRMIGPDVCTAP